MFTRNARVCPECESISTYVYDSRIFDTYIYRRRKCADCGCKFSGYEICAADFKKVKELMAKVVDGGDK